MTDEARIEPQALSTIEALARMARGPDPAAWEALLVRHGPSIQTVCLRILRDPALAEDACQETLLQLRDRSDRFRPPQMNAERFAGHWILRVACNTALQMRRARKRMNEREDRAARAQPVRDEGPDTRLEAIHEVLAQLPERQRLPLLLHFIGGLSYEELAQALRCPVGTAKARVHRGLESLRQRLAYAGLVLPAGALAEDLGRAFGPAVEGSAAAPQAWLQLLNSARTPRFDGTANGGLSVMAKLGLGTVAVLAALAAGIALTSASGGERPNPAGPAVASGVRSKSEAERQVERLSHESFAERQSAFAALKAMGAGARTALLAGTKSQDQEARKRCAELLLGIESAAAKARIQWIYRSEGGSLSPPMWGGQSLGFQARDGKATLGVDAQTGKLRWRHEGKDTNFTAYQSVLAVRGLFLISAYAGQEIVLVALDAATGAERWKVKAAVSTIFHGDDDAVDGGRLFVCSIAGDKTYASGIDLDTGKETWRYEDPKGQVRDVVARGNVCLVLSSSPDGMVMRAVNIETRAELWSRWLDRPTDALHLADGVLYHAGGQILSACPQKQVDTKQYIQAVELATGKVRWEYVAKESDWYSDKVNPNEPGIGTIRMARGADRVGHLVERSGRLYFGANGHLYALNAQSGELDWKFKLEGVSLQTVPWMHADLKKMSANGPKQMIPPPPINGPAYADGLLYFGSWDGIHAVDADSGFERWRLATQEPVMHRPVANDGVLYFCCQQGSVDKVRFLHEMDPKKIAYKVIDTLFAVSIRDESFGK